MAKEPGAILRNLADDGFELSVLPELLGASERYAEGEGTRAGRVRHVTVSLQTME